MRPPLPVPTISRRAKIIIGVIVLLVLALSVLGSLVRLYVDWLWFTETGYRAVFRTGLWTRIFLFLLFGIVMAAVVAANLIVAYRFRPPFRPMSAEQQNLERYRSALDPRRRTITIVVSGVLGLFAGITAQAQWQTWLLWRNGQRFNIADPQFHRDISYYAFTYPFQRMILGYLFTAVVLAFLVSLVVHYLFGGVRVQTPGEKVTPAARVHLSVLLGIFVLLKAVGYYLDRFGLLFNSRDNRTGASYTDVNAVLPAKTILFVVALICAVAFFANILLRNVQLPAIALVLLVLTSIVTSGIYPTIVQQFTVKPNQDQKEKLYIARNIAATRQAYGIQSRQDGGPVEYINYTANTTASPATLRNDTGTIPNARLLDPNVLSPTYTQLQQIRNVYGFPDKLNIDRYTINGKTQDYVVALRELKTDNLTGNQRNWINEHTVYTHGNGFVAAAANKGLRSSGDFTEGGLPTTGPITVDQPRIYYGELIKDYSIVGGSGDAREFDRPGSGDTDVKNTYDGAGGVRVGGFFNRLAFAIYYRERNILLSGAVKPNSKILYVRDPVSRVQKAAPFLKVDSVPYPAVVGGRIEWIVDAYTTMDNFPYSQRQTLGQVTTDSLSQQGRQLPNQEANYIRNSVKATVDAYDGTVTLYEFDPTDPVLKTWERAYPGIVKPQRDISAELRAHFRYPEDLFKVQRELLTRYHVDDPVRFFNNQDFWRVPDDPTPGNSAAQPPYYILAQAPGQSAPTFQLTSALNTLQRENLGAYITVASDPGDYGHMRVLNISGSQAVAGPGQVFGKFSSTTAIASTVSLLDQHGSEVRWGNLLTLPVGGGLLYVEPLYVQGTSVSYPILQKVLVAFGDKVAFDDTLALALDSLFGAGAGAQASDTGTGGSTSTTAPPPSTGSAGPTGSTSPSPSTSGAPAAISSAVAGLDRALADLRAATQRGDFAAIGQAESELGTAINAYNRVARATPTQTGSRSTTPSPTPSASRSP